MKIEIKNRWNGSVLFSCEMASIHLAVTMAIESGADLTDADLTGANLTDADLTHVNLTDADLTGANLTDANLTDADLTHVNLTGADLTRANLTHANLADADLTHVNLTGADLTDADLTRANLDYSCWPLWCGSKSVKVNLKLSMQLAAHFCALQCDAPEFKEARKSIIKFALKSHRAKDLGITSVE